MMSTAITGLLLASAFLFEGVKTRYTKTFRYDKPDCAPVWWGGESRSVEAYGSDYCIFLDIIYTDGTGAWQKWAKWTAGTHDWEYTSKVFLPEKPVAKIECHAFLRHGGGQAEFRNVFLRREAPPVGTNLAVQRKTNLPVSDEDEVAVCTFDGTNCVWTKRMESPSAFRPANPLAPKAAKVWSADSMSLVAPLEFPDPAATNGVVRLDVCRGESEGFQACLSTGAETELEDVELVPGEFRDEKGDPFPGEVRWERVGFVPLPSEFHHHPASHHAGMRWVPDPLLPAAPMRVRRGSTQPVLVTFAAARGAKAGTYRGEVRFTAGGRRLKGPVPVEVRVRGFELPRAFGLKTGFAMMDGFLQKLYPDRFREMRRRAWDLMLDHRLNPDDVTRTTPPDIGELLHARERGMNYFTVQNIVRPKPDQPWTLKSTPEELGADEFWTWFSGSLRPYVAELRRHGLDRLAAVYGFDERKEDYYPVMARMYPKLKRELGLPLLTSAMLYRDVMKGTLASNSVEALSADWYVPLTQNWRDGTTDWFRSQGKEVWWYVCCGPVHPYANFSSYEYPPAEARVLVGWQTFAHRPDGFLFWAVNFWSRIDRPLDEGDVFFDIDTFSKFDMPGDGVMTYPGRGHILSGLHLASVRDAVEDYEWLQLAEKADPAATRAAIERVTRGLKDWNSDSANLRRARRELADVLEGVPQPCIREANMR